MDEVFEEAKEEEATSQQYSTYSLSERFKKDILILMERMIVSYNRYWTAVKSKRNIYYRKRELVADMISLFSMLLGSVKSGKIKLTEDTKPLTQLEEFLERRDMPKRKEIKKYFNALIIYIYDMGITQIEFKRLDWETVVQK